jgi:hypothetical protein
VHGCALRAVPERRGQRPGRALLPFLLRQQAVQRDRGRSRGDLLGDLPGGAGDHGRRRAGVQAYRKITATAEPRGVALGGVHDLDAGGGPHRETPHDQVYAAGGPRAQQPVELTALVAGELVGPPGAQQDRHPPGLGPPAGGGGQLAQRRVLAGQHGLVDPPDVVDELVQQAGQPAGADEGQHPGRGQRREPGEATAELLGVVPGEPHPAGLRAAQRAQQQARHHVVADPLVTLDHDVPLVEQRHQRGHLPVVRQQQPPHPQLRRRGLGAGRRGPPLGPGESGSAGRGRHSRLGRGGGQRGQVTLVLLVDLPQPLVPLAGQPDPAFPGGGGHPGPPGHGRFVRALRRPEGVVGRAQGVRQRGPHLDDLLRPGVRHRRRGVAGARGRPGRASPDRGPAGPAARRSARLR